MSNLCAYERGFLRVAEIKIQTAIERGEFEKIEGMGKPFEFNERDYHPNWWVVRKLERERLQRIMAPTPTIDND